MAKNFTFTLTRWHKIAERLNAFVNEAATSSLKQANLSLAATSRGALSEADIQEKNATILAKIAQAEIILQDVAVIREAIARANTDLGISKHLAQMDVAQRQFNLLNNLVTQEQDRNAISVQTFNQNTNVEVSYHQTAIQVLSATEIKVIQARALAAKRTMVQLSDDIAVKNASTLALSISDEAAQAASLV
jgi:hypothetical protein